MNVHYLWLYKRCRCSVQDYLCFCALYHLQVPAKLLKFLQVKQSTKHKWSFTEHQDLLYMYSQRLWTPHFSIKLQVTSFSDLDIAYHHNNEWSCITLLHDVHKYSFKRRPFSRPGFWNFFLFPLILNWCRFYWVITGLLHSTFHQWL